MSESGPKAVKKDAPSDTPEGVFNLASTLLNEDIVKKVNATFLFVADGNNPGL